MSLERFRRTKIVILNPQSMVYQAARAMEDNHIGSVLVSGGENGPAGILTDRDLALAVLGGDLDPDATTLGEIMSEDVVSCGIGANLDEVTRLMKEYHVRRVPITENGRSVGLITFDDLIVDGTVGRDALRDIVVAQLEVEAPLKPAGALHPQKPARPEQQATGQTRALMRAKVRADEVSDRLVEAIAHSGSLDYVRSERAMLIGLCMLCRRLVPREAQHLIAQLPSKLHPHLDRCLDGPNRAVTEEAIRDEIAQVLGIESDAASAVLRAIFSTVSDTVSSGQIDEVRGQLPEAMKSLFPQPVS